jgi:hypothetical protein
MQWSRMPLILFVLLPVCGIVGGASAVGSFWAGVFFAVVYLIFAGMTKYVLFDD